MTNAAVLSQPYHQSESQIDLERKQIEAAKQDRQAFRPIYEKYYEGVFRFVYKRTADSDLTADITSQIFLKAMSRLDGYEFRGIPFSAWLYRIASNEVVQHFRRNAKDRVVYVDEVISDEIVEEVDHLDFEVKRELLSQALKELDEDRLILIEMRFFEKRSFQEIGEILDMTANNAKVKTYRSIDQLKKIIRENKAGDE